jgi:sirohydrochlorin cobaltochelatase
MTGRNAIIGLAHGSRHPGVGGAIDALMSATADLVGWPARAAYLDLTDPDLNSVALDLEASGARRAVVLPLLFTNAFHATVDVPAAVAEAAALANLDLITGEILGTGDDVADVLQAAAIDAGIAPHLPLLLYAVGSSDAAANSAVGDLAQRLSAQRGTEVRATFGTTDPRPGAVLDEFGSGGPVGIVPLFVSPGVLLDPLAHLAHDRGWPMVPPLGRRLAPVLAARVADAV